MPAPGMVTMECTIPEGHVPGRKLIWDAHDGRKVQLNVPDDATPGQVIEFEVPESCLPPSKAEAPSAPPAAAAPAPAADTVWMEVEVPSTWKPGAKLTATLESGVRVLITPPDSTEPGATLEFQVPAGSAPTGGAAAPAEAEAAPAGEGGFFTKLFGLGGSKTLSKVDVIEKYRTAAWDGKWVEDAAEGAVFIHGGQEMPIGAFLGWCSAVGAAGSFPDWKWTNYSVEELEDGRVKVGSQQSTGKLVADIPAIGPFPEVKLSEVPADSLLLTDAGAILPIEVGYYTFDADLKVTKIEYDGTLDEQVEGVNTLESTPKVGPPLLYALAGKDLSPPPAEEAPAEEAPAE